MFFIVWNQLLIDNEEIREDISNQWAGTESSVLKTSKAGWCFDGMNKLVDEGEAADVTQLGISQLLATVSLIFIGTSGSANLSNWVGEMCGAGLDVLAQS